jgi:hypothetical protein
MDRWIQLGDGRLAHETPAGTEAIMSLAEAQGYLALAEGKTPADWLTWKHLGTARFVCGDDYGGLAACRKAVELNRCAGTLHDLACILMSFGWFEEALICQTEANRLEPDNWFAGLGLADNLMRFGRWTEAWPLYERYNWGGIWEQELVNYLPQWEGQDLQGARLLVFQWGGYGDQILFLRWFKELRERGVRDITFVCPDKLVPLLAGHPWIDRFVPTHEGANLDAFIDMEIIPSEHDYFASVVGMARRLFLSPEDPGLQWSGPYIRPPVAQTSAFEVCGSSSPVDTSRRPDTGVCATAKKPLVGLCWKAGEVLDPRKHRSMTVVQASRLLAVDSVEWVNLTCGEEPPGVYSPRLDDWGDTANIVGGLDLVISVDTGVAHLAGAMGKPCWVVLPSFSACWYGVGRETNRFYPSFRHFRNPPGKCGMNVSVDNVINELVGVRLGVPCSASA